jgi:hypothetical protein
LSNSAASPERDVKEVDRFLSLLFQKLGDVFLVVRVAEGFGIKEHQVSMLYQTFFLDKA